MIELGVIGLNREFGTSQSGHATVTASDFAEGRTAFLVTDRFFLGRRKETMNWSQENCLIDNHRLTCEWRGWGFDFVKMDAHTMPECMRHGIFVWSSAQPVSSSWGKGLFVWSDSERLIFLFGMKGGSRTMSNGAVQCLIVSRSAVIWWNPREVVSNV